MSNLDHFTHELKMMKETLKEVQEMKECDKIEFRLDRISGHIDGHQLWVGGQSFKNWRKIRWVGDAISRTLPEGWEKYIIPKIIEGLTILIEEKKEEIKREAEFAIKEEKK